MEHTVIKGKSRRSRHKEQAEGSRKETHFRTVRSGGFDESQIICYLWELVKSLEDLVSSDGEEIETDGGTKTCVGKLRELEKEVRSRVRVEIRRYFLRQKRRNRKKAAALAVAVAGVLCVFHFLIGMDRVSGISMYPYLNHGDWIVYSRVGGKLQRGEVVVFEKNGEGMVKRITGLPGDRVEISASGYQVVVNGMQMRENYISQPGAVMKEKEMELPDQMSVPLIVMDGQYLVLGDNRGESIDSRDSEIGTVPEKDILGRVVVVIRLRG